MAAALWMAAVALGPWLAPGTGTVVRLAALSGLVGTGLVVYLIAVLLLGILDQRQLRNLLRRNPVGRRDLSVTAAFGGPCLCTPATP